LPEQEEKKSLPRSKVVGMPVYSPDAFLVGNAQDLGVFPGEQRITLIIKTKYGTTVEIPWTDVGPIGDIIILSKPVKVEVPAGAVAQPVTVTPAAAQPATASTPPVVICPKCGKPATYIPQYQRYYCYTDKKYV
jgi:sporulation protein YlmC with PRC-barrel domain